jgi:hypothetical protein
MLPFQTPIARSTEKGASTTRTLSTETDRRAQTDIDSGESDPSSCPQQWKDLTKAYSSKAASRNDSTEDAKAYSSRDNGVRDSTDVDAAV